MIACRRLPAPESESVVTVVVLSSVRISSDSVIAATAARATSVRILPRRSCRVGWIQVVGERYSFSLIIPIFSPELISLHAVRQQVIHMQTQILERLSQEDLSPYDPIYRL